MRLHGQIDSPIILGLSPHRSTSPKPNSSHAKVYAVNSKKSSQSLRLSDMVSGFVLLALWITLITFQFCKLSHASIWHDAAVFAQVAKNLVLGNGYATAAFDKLEPLQIGISSGPVIILPAALMIKLFGNTNWAPGLASIILINVLLIIAFCQLKPLIAVNASRYQCAGLFLLNAILVTNYSTGPQNPTEKMYLWYALMGEIPGALLVLIATLHIAKERYNPKRIFTGGLLAGLGSLCKLQAILGVGSLGIYLALFFFTTRRLSHLKLHSIIINLLLYGAGAFLPMLLFEMVKIVYLGGWDNYLKNADQLKLVLKDSYSSVIVPNFYKIYELGNIVGINTYTNSFPFLKAYLATALFIVLIIILFWKILQLCISRLQKNTTMTASPARWSSDALLFCCMIHLFWWVFISSAFMPRYAMQGILYGCACLSLVLNSSIITNPYKERRNTLIAAAIIICLRYDAVMYLSTAMEYDNIFIEQKEVLHVLDSIQHTAPDTIIFTCGHADGLEYLMPKSANFVQCERILEPAFAFNNKVLLSFTFEDSGRLIYFQKNSIVWHFRYNSYNALSLCPINDLFAGKNYFLASCGTYGMP